MELDFLLTINKNTLIVSSIKEISLMKDGNLFKSFIFDRFGNLIHAKNYHIEGIGGDWTLKYNEQNKLIQKINERDQESWMYIYDQSGNLIQSIWTNRQAPNLINVALNIRDREPLIKNYFYENDILIETLCDSIVNQYYDHWKYFYDNRGNLVQKVSFKRNGDENLKYLYEFDENNNLISSSGTYQMTKNFLYTLENKLKTMLVYLNGSIPYEVLEIIYSKELPEKIMKFSNGKKEPSDIINIKYFEHQ